MSTQLQTKLLRFLQDGTFRKVGDENEVKVNVRIIAATQKDLPAMVQEGTVREDLYYRLNVVNLKLPPLCERREDISLLAQHFALIFLFRVKEKLLLLNQENWHIPEQYTHPMNVLQKILCFLNLNQTPDLKY